MASLTKWNMNNPTEVQDIPALVQHAKADPLAFGRLYDHYVQPIYRYLYSRVGTRHDAEDLTSQTFLAALEHLPRYRERGQFAAWLFRIARSKLMDHLRASRHEAGLEPEEESATESDALVQVLHSEEVRCLRSLIRNLNAEEQDLIRLRYVAELNFAEIGELLGKREGAVKQTLYRLLARLKSQME